MTEEIQSVMQGKSVLPLTHRNCIVFLGEDRARFLNGQTTNDVLKLAEGHAIHAAVCTAKGKMQGELIIANAGDHLLVDYPESLAETLPQRLEKYIIADDVEMQEPASALKGYHLLTATPPELPTDGHSFLSKRLGHDGYDIWLPDTITPAFPVATEAATEWIRIQSGIPLWGVDIDENNMPPEAYPEGQTISYRKGCYIGQETIAKIKSIGRVTKMLCLFQGNETLATLPAEITKEGKVIGQITSCQKTPDSDGRVLALGMIQRNSSEPGATFELNGSAWQIVRRCN